MFVFQKIWRAFSWNTRFEIRPGLISSKKILPVHVLTLECTSKNGQTQFKNPVAFAARFLD